MDLKDKVAVLTAAGGGIGRSVAIEFGRRGAHVLVSDRDGAAANAVAADINAAGGIAIAVACDVASDDDIAALVSAADKLGPVGVLHNNAGVAAGGPIGAVPLDDWRWVFEINVLGMVRAINAFLPGMCDRGTGLIINTASSLGLFPEVPLVLPYICSKAGILGLSEALGPICAAQGVRVMVLVPDITDTNFHYSARLSGVDAEQALQSLPLANLQPPQAVADALFQAIESGEFIATNVPDARALLSARAKDGYAPKLRAYPMMAESIEKSSALLTGASHPGPSMTPSATLGSERA